MYCYFCMKETAEQSGCCTCCGKPYAQNAGPNCLAPGTVLKDKYMIGAVLGKGGFGVTYAGRDTTLDLRIAVKEYFPDGHANRNVMMTNDVTLTTGPNEEYFLNGKERFLTEAKTLAKFNRAANIVHARDYFEANGTAYIVMDFVEGDSLKNYLRENGRIEPEKLVKWFMPILEVLGKVHAEGLVHRDISPDNILIEDGELVLIDFGAARDLEMQKELSIVMKPGYAPGEQYSSDSSMQGSWTDVYAVCATMYECITGVMPPDSSKRWQNDQLQSPTALGIPIPQHIESALLHGLALKVQNRTQTMAQLIAELNGADPKTVPMEDDPKTVLMDDPKTVLMTAEPEPAKTGKKKPLILAAACAVLLLGGIGTVTALAKNRQKTPDVSAELSSTAGDIQTEERAAAETDPAAQTEALPGDAAESNAEGLPTESAADSASDSRKDPDTEKKKEQDPDAEDSEEEEEDTPSPVTHTKKNRNTSQQNDEPAAQPEPERQPASNTEKPKQTEPPVQTEPPREKSDYQYEQWYDGAIITGLSKNLTQLDIPAYLNGWPVKAIGDGAFSDRASVQGVNLPDTLEVIGAHAFSGCESLLELSIPDSVTEIGEFAFQGSGIEKLKLSSGLHEISDKACYGMEYLERICIPSGIERIGVFAFGACDWLDAVYIPASVRQICSSAFGEYATDLNIYYASSSAEWNGISNDTMLAPKEYNVPVNDFM